MNIGKYTFEEFKELAAAFHSYPAPGLLLGGYMVEMARRQLPEGTLFEAMVESAKCLPDAVQLLTLCSTGNQWMKVIPLGRYAVSLYDKYTGQGYRVYVDEQKLKAWPEYYAWFMKLRPKAEQDSDQLFAEIEEAGETVCGIQPIQINPKYLGHSHMGDVGVCPVCKEPYPARDGGICRGCQGEAPYVIDSRDGQPDDVADVLERAPLRIIPAEQAEGKKALHDMTEIVPDEHKGPSVLAGQTLEAGDLCRLQRMGKFNVYDDSELPSDEWVHENAAVEAFAKRIAGDGVAYELPPREGKINFTAAHAGVLTVDLEALERFNLVPDVMLATRHGYSVIEEGKQIAGSRAIPLYLSQEYFSRALTALGDSPVLSVKPMVLKKAGVLVTGTEVFQGLIEDRFIPIVSSKLMGLGWDVTVSRIVPDDKDAISQAVRDFMEQGVELVVTTAGMSVDPDDVTRAGLVDAGLSEALYGLPVLPGTMTLVGRLRHGGRTARVIGVPACALYYKTTGFDLLLPRLLADCDVTRRDLARLAEGGFCHNCKACTWPKCSFGK
ncbi:FmdE family protein [Oleidesulfovibrio sp.]|uniref:FmdE family protein n=1 Tax=Oleidesulfovibrio sp. TaxID=2909707 RepID=UPI003A86287E